MRRGQGSRFRGFEGKCEGKKEGRPIDPCIKGSQTDPGSEKSIRINVELREGTTVASCRHITYISHLRGYDLEIQGHAT